MRVKNFQNSKIMNRHTDEAFDFTGMSDVDYTDTFADIDQAEEERMEFIHGLRHVLSFCRNSDYTMLEWSDPSLDRMFDAPGCVTGSRKDGYVVSLSDIGCEIGFNTYHDGVPVVVASLDLDLSRAPAGWPSAKWGFGGNNF